jgi:hypothetical protein
MKADEIEIRNETGQEVTYTVTPVVADRWSEGYARGAQAADEAWAANLNALTARWVAEAERRKGSEDRYGGCLMEQLADELRALVEEVVA